MQLYEWSYALNRFYCCVNQNQLYSRIYRLQYNSESYNNAKASMWTLGKMFHQCIKIQFFRSFKIKVIFHDWVPYVLNRKRRRATATWFPACGICDGFVVLRFIATLSVHTFKIIEFLSHSKVNKNSYIKNELFKVKPPVCFDISWTKHLW